MLHEPNKPELHIAFAVDDNGGMMFNHRRVSKDSKLREELLGMAEASKGRILIRPYSLSQFEEGEMVCAFDNPWEEAKPGDIVFIEDLDPAAVPTAAKVTLFRWNRSYPSDLKSSLSLAGYDLVEESDFTGTSHERIAKEAWQISR